MLRFRFKEWSFHSTRIEVLFKGIGGPGRRLLEFVLDSDFLLRRGKRLVVCKHLLCRFGCLAKGKLSQV